MNKKIVAMMAAAIISVTLFSNNVLADYYSDYKTLRYGMSSSEVKSLQIDLQKLGYFRGTATGYFGSITMNSVLAYQRNNNLQADGIVGHKTARELKVDNVIQTAKSYQGVPYVWGGTSPSGFDCSGFVHYTLLQNDIIIPRTTETQYSKGYWVSRDQLIPGDLVFFSTYKAGPSHVGIYVGDGQFIHASSGAGKIKISSLSNTYYSQHYIGAKRIID